MTVNADKTFYQDQSGTYTCVTPQSIAYAGNYQGRWTATRAGGP